MRAQPAERSVASCSRYYRDTSRWGCRPWLPAAGGAALGWLLLLVCTQSASGLINPNYTPVDLVNQSEVILRLEVGLPDEQGNLPAKVLKVLQGHPPPAVSLRLDVQNAEVGKDFPEAVGPAGRARAVLLSGDFDADGLLDLVAGTAQGSSVLGNLGEGRFRGVLEGRGGERQLR